MRWLVIARRDLSLTVAARSTKLLLGLGAGAILLMAYLYPVSSPDPITTARFPAYVRDIVTAVVPLVGLLVGYGAVVSERESGELRLLLALPRSRRDVVVGTYASRAGVVVAALLAAFVGAGFLVVYPLGELVVWPFVGFVLLTLGFATIWCGLGVAVSTAVATRRRALVLSVGLLFLFVIVWDVSMVALEVALEAAGVVDDGVPAPVRFLAGAEPGHVFDRLTTGFVVPGGDLDGPWYLGRWPSLAVFVGWLLAPPTLAYYRFAGRDLL